MMCYTTLKAPNVFSAAETVALYFFKKVFNTENYTGLDVKLKRSQAPVIV